MTSQPDVKGKVQAQFGDVAANYRLSKVHAAGKDLDLLVESAALSPGMRVLDAGCGAGHTALALAPRVRRVIACDFTRAMLRQLESLADERGATNIETQLADVEDLPFPAASFDRIFTRYSAHHWLHPARALAEFRRLLRADGALLISDIMAHEDYARDTFLQTIELLRDSSHVRDFRLSEWRALLAEAGFKSEVLMRFDLTLNFTTWTRRMATPPQNIDMLKALFNGAPADVKRGFNLPETVASDDFAFTIPGAVIRGVLT